MECNANTRAPLAGGAGMFMFLAGFFLWNMDNIFCHHLTATKNSMKLPWSVVLEGHGWWHILTGLGKPPVFLFLPLATFCEGALLFSMMTITILTLDHAGGMYTALLPCLILPSTNLTYLATQRTT